MVHNDFPIFWLSLSAVSGRQRKVKLEQSTGCPHGPLFADLWSIGAPGNRGKKKLVNTASQIYISTSCPSPGDLEEDLSTQLKFHSWLRSTDCQYEGKRNNSKVCSKLNSKGDLWEEADKLSRTKGANSRSWGQIHIHVTDIQIIQIDEVVWSVNRLELPFCIILMKSRISRVQSSVISTVMLITQVSFIFSKLLQLIPFCFFKIMICPPPPPVY